MASNRGRRCAGSGARASKLECGIEEVLKFNSAICVVFQESTVDVF